MPPPHPPHQGKKGGIQWINVARFVGKRNGQQCLCRWKTLQMKERNGVDSSQEKDDVVSSLDTAVDTRHRFWTAAEERRLCLAVRALIEPKKGAGDAPAGKRQRGSGATSAGVNGGKTVGSKRHVNWIEVAKLMMGTRDSERCREKWLNTMDPSVNTSRFWSEAEDAKLLEGEIRSWGVGCGLRSRCSTTGLIKKILFCQFSTVFL